MSPMKLISTAPINAGNWSSAAHRVVHRTDTGEFYYTGFHYADFRLVKDIP